MTNTLPANAVSPLAWVFESIWRGGFPAMQADTAADRDLFYASYLQTYLQRDVRDVGVAPNTAKQWLSILQASGLVWLLEPYHTNVSKRMVKAPKLYFLDSGLAAYLTEWSSPAMLEAGAMSGAIFETWVVSELLKSYWHRPNALHGPTRLCPGWR